MPAWDSAAPWKRGRLAPVVGGLAALLLLIGGAAQGQDTTLGGALELVDPNVLRVCADPGNMPFSNTEEEGFENRLAELVAEELGRSSVAYTWFPQVIGFVRNTLGAHRCDIIMGYAQGDELVQNTNHYYRTSYVLVFKPDNGLDGVTSLDDPRLRDKRIGVIARTPPATNMARYGLMKRAKPYPLMVDTRHYHPARDMIDDIKSGEIDAGVLWGPIGGYWANQSDPPLTVVPLVNEKGGSRMVYRITMGVRPSDQNWKRTLNEVIRENQDDINQILADYGVPLLDEQDRPLEP
ncbi:MAG TPA: substrate-binding domain-containing protein [Afifellaceae bacterium]|nr:substrate-binding domain-containing protein [Afifellaceae bacterium]